MALNRNPAMKIPYGFLRLFLVLYCFYVSYGTQTDVHCLRRIRTSLQDPFNYLYSWDFTNKSEGAVCRFSGITCWHDDENRVFSIKLTDMGLTGGFPIGFENCTSLNWLDLSGNELSGSIPSNMSKVLRYVTVLDLSDNEFSGAIPFDLANCEFLNTLKLDHNRFSGEIPLQLGQLGRLKTFHVSNNNLSGPVPNFSPNVSITKDDYANNPGLCGGPLGAFLSSGKTVNVGMVVEVGAASFTLVIVLVVVGTIFAGQLRKSRMIWKVTLWPKAMKGTKGVKVALFEKTVSKMRLSDLMKATNSFSNTNIIGTGPTGTLYKATLPDGTFLTVKRLQDSQRSEREFLSEINTLGSVKHRNLVPILGFCIAKKERFLVYKYMENGNLFDCLHPSDPDSNTMDWLVRLKIAIGAARGLAWLHHIRNPRIIHRNISSKCILLDEDFEPKLSDFELARLNPMDIHLSAFVNREFGSLGYVAPEYPRTLVITPEGNV